MPNLSSSVQYLSGVGARRSESYQKLGINTIEDLLYHFPRYYVDLSSPYSISDAPVMESCPVKAVLVSKSREQRIRKGLSIYKLIAVDDTGELEITIFNAKYLVSGLNVGEAYIFYGKFEGGFSRRKTASPNIYPANQQYAILPVYSQTAGIASTLIRRNVAQAMAELPPLEEPIPKKYLSKYQLEELGSAMRNIHFPESIERAQLARERFVFEELLTLACALYMLRSTRESVITKPFSSTDMDQFYRSLPYTPTKAQLRCIAEALEDMGKNIPMNRLIQGDVGSGKTLVAAAAIYFVFKNGAQSALMVPTEILAEQHYDTLSSMLSPFGVEVRLLTGSTKASARRETLAGLEDGSVQLCIGTHALLSDQIRYNNLALVITDEQHRFGVAQRAVLSEKSETTHVLVMSATPIPRTLSLIIYGDLSLSLLDEMPPGRKPVDTLLIDQSKLKRALGFVREKLKSGQQAYIVCPLVEQGQEDTGLRPAVEYSQYLAEGEFKGYHVGLLHGKMKPRDKETVMRDFKAGRIQLLVSTTVVEVGVDVPNATIMLIENAERFGLSQLHQLRGRVGRGSKKSYCILVSDAKGESSQKRLSAMKNISDGFKLAEYDLKLRGPGDFFGYRQHGLPALRVADLAENLDTMTMSQQCASLILKDDPQLSAAPHQPLKHRVDKMMEAVGQRPN